MIKLKKIMALGLSALMVTSLVGCGGTTNATETKSQTHQKEQRLLFGIALQEQTGICL